MNPSKLIASILKMSRGLKIESFVSELAGIADLGMRSVRIIERLKEMPDSDAGYAINMIIGGHLQGRTKYKQVYLALIKNRDLAKALGKEKGQSVHSMAVQKGYEMVVELFDGPKIDKREEEDREPSALSQKLMHLTLGEKKAFARRKDFKHLEFLLHDANPPVIANLLKNPRITDREVIKIAADRNTTRGVLEEIFNNDKWLSRYRVRKALVFNRRTPLDISLSLCTFLLRQDLALIARDNKLDSHLVRKARALLEAK